MARHVPIGKLLRATACAAFALVAAGSAGADELSYGSPYADQPWSAYSKATGYDTLWVRADYLYWQLTGSKLPPLVTQSAASVLAANAGTFNDPNVQTLAGGGSDVMNGWRSGWAIKGGYWLDPCAGWAITGDFFDAGRDSYGFTAGPETAGFLARPYFNTQNNTEAAEIINGTGQFRTGSVSVNAYTDFLSAGGSMQVCILGEGGPVCVRGNQLNLVGGYRYYHHDSFLGFESFKIAETGNTPGYPANVAIAAQESFSARNEFHGFELGFSGRVQRYEWWADGLAVIAIGGNRRVAFVNGERGDLTPGDLLTSGLTNIGRYEDTKGLVIPRFRLGVGCQLTERISAHLGYNLIIWDDVTQAAALLPQVPAGAQSPAVDPRNVPQQPSVTGGGASPAFPGLQDKTIVAHGMDLGLEVAF